MKTATAKLNYLRIAPRKVRIVSDLIRGLSIQDAEAQLILRHKHASGPLLKLLRSAIANAKNKNMVLDKMFVSAITVDGGPMLKRGLPRAMGRVTPIQKKTSHISLILTEGDKIYPVRYNIVKVKKDKKSKTDAKAPKPKKEKQVRPAATDRAKAHQAEPGFFKKMFRRKSV